jgi:hypothetical protein
VIDLNKPEPPEYEKRCDWCHQKRGKLIGTLIHVPRDDYKNKTWTNMRGEKIEAFSFWSYSCNWCRGIETKRKNRENRRHQ